MVAASLYHLAERARIDVEEQHVANLIEQAASLMEEAQRMLRGTLLVDGGSPRESGYLLSEGEPEE